MALAGKLGHYRLLTLLDMHLAGVKRGAQGLMVAVGNSTAQGVFFGRAAEPAQHRVSGGEPVARHVPTGQLAFLEEGVHHMGGDAQHPGGGLYVEHLGVSGLGNRERMTSFSLACRRYGRTSSVP
jgi:hypothetical protein